MITWILTLPGDDPDPDPDIGPRDAALAALSSWLRRWGGDVRSRWVLGPHTIMVDATDAALADLPAMVERRAQPRTTRWAVLARVSGSRRLGAVAEVVVCPHAEALAADADPRVRVLGVGDPGADLAVLRLPRERLTGLRVGKLDHPLLLFALEREASEGRYWPATSEAHRAAVAYVDALKTAGDGAEPG